LHHTLLSLHRLQIVSTKSQANLYHFKKQNGIDFNTIYDDIKDRLSRDRRVFDERYNYKLFDGMILVDAIETYNKKLNEAKNSINEIFDNICQGFRRNEDNILGDINYSQSKQNQYNSFQDKAESIFDDIK